ncbi:MAG: Bifunctional protein Aas [Phycisphaerales bacterium]|nr:Bifunctional protein Aas [Phycisphaerales bacterium]
MSANPTHAAGGSLSESLPAATTAPTLLYRVCRGLAWWFMRIFYRAQRFNSHHVPATGAALVAANHQSYLDPPLVGMVERKMNFVAKSGLFRFKPFGWLIENLNSVPLREDTSDVAAIKEVVRRLEAGNAVVIFPEGSRTDTGAMEPFKRGVALLVKKARCPVVPAAVEGCFDAWPRGSAPRLFGKRIAVKYGPPIPHDELMKGGADAALERLAREIDVLRLELRAYLRSQTDGRYPPPGPGDHPRVPQVAGDQRGEPSPRK